LPAQLLKLRLILKKKLHAMASQGELKETKPFLVNRSGSMLETGLSLNRVTTVGEQMLERLRSLDRNQESIGKGERVE
jgi:hypothetical protein